MNRLSLLVSILVLNVFTAHAGFRVTYEAVSYSEEGDTPEVVSRQQNALLIDQGKLRTVNGDMEGFDLIADLKTSSIYVLDAKSRTFALIDFPPVDESDTDAGSGVFQIDVQETAPPMLGYAVQHYRIYEDSTLWREIWTTKELNLGFDYMRAMEGLQRAFQELTPDDEFDQLTALFRRVRGVPLSDIQVYPFGRDVLQAKKVERVKFGAAEFRPPKNYEQKKLKDLSESAESGHPQEQPAGP